MPAEIASTACIFGVGMGAASPKTGSTFVDSVAPHVKAPLALRVRSTDYCRGMSDGIMKNGLFCLCICGAYMFAKLLYGGNSPMVGLQSTMPPF